MHVSDPGPNPRKRRKDAVLCIEHLITASPEWAGWGTEKKLNF